MSRGWRKAGPSARVRSRPPRVVVWPPSVLASSPWNHQVSLSLVSLVSAPTPPLPFASTPYAQAPRGVLRAVTCHKRAARAREGAYIASLEALVYPVGPAEGPAADPLSGRRVTPHVGEIPLSSSSEPCRRPLQSLPPPRCAALVGETHRREGVLPSASSPNEIPPHEVSA